VIKLKKLLMEQPPQPPQKKPEGGGDDAPKPQKLKIDIPQTPFEPDVNQVKGELKKILKQWQIKQYPSDEFRWKDYYKDILKLVKTLEGDK
tara:strand:- start:149 stop:421 length:273 start_codon:yes stop_codon:yes gene_type:complete